MGGTGRRPNVIVLNKSFETRILCLIQKFQPFQAGFASPVETQPPTRDYVGKSKDEKKNGAILSIAQLVLKYIGIFYQYLISYLVINSFHFENESYLHIALNAQNSHFSHFRFIDSEISGIFTNLISDIVRSWCIFKNII